MKSRSPDSSIASTEPQQIKPINTYNPTMATFSTTIPLRSGTVKVECDGVSLIDFHLIVKQLQDSIASRHRENPGPMRPLEPEERSPISMTSWHTPTLGELDTPFEEETTPVPTEKPKRPMNAYFHFLAENRPIIKGLGFTGREIISEASRQWKVMDLSSKIRYAEMAKADKIRYSEQMDAYKPSQPVIKTEIPSTSVEKETTPLADIEKAEKKKRAEIRKEYKKTRGIACPFACFGCKKEYMSKNKCYEKHIKACKFNPEPPNYDGSDGRKTYETLDESDDEEEALDVKEIEINGKTYYHSEADNRLFDPDTQDQVGFYKDGLIV